MTKPNPENKRIPIKGLITYYILSCLISWLIWLPLVLNKQFGYSIPVLSYQHYLASIGPMAAAIIIILSYQGIEGLTDFTRNIFRIKGKTKWIWFGILSPLVMFLIAIVINFAITKNLPNILRFGIPDDLPNFNIIGAIFLWIITYGFGEEIGWRGVALSNLQSIIKPMYAAVIIGLSWAVWHIPAFFFRDTYMAMGAFQIIGWAISLIFGSIFLTWLYNVSGRSVLVTALWHALFDAATVGAISKGIIPMVLSVTVIVMTIAIMPKISREKIIEQVK